VTIETERDNIQKLLIGRQTASHFRQDKKSSFISGFTGSTIQVLQKSPRKELSEMRKSPSVRELRSST
jgi:hypothetical protein